VSNDYVPSRYEMICLIDQYS